ncbi:MAG: peptide ABC transporter substrate-binding protein [Deltaproteobacteria bacterium]|nr:peptide ABC transporter substrate-binding protein [Deltaproteobacteria bacterium]
MTSRGILELGFGLLFAILVGVLAASPATSFAARAPTKILRVRTLGDPLTLDWNRAYSPVESILIRNLMEGLVAIGPKMTVVPATASRWEISKDGKTYTFHLRKDVRWSDGVPLKARHFVDSWHRLLEPSFNGNYAYLLDGVEGARDFHDGKLKEFASVGVKALDDLTLRVQLTLPIAYWIWIPTFWSTFPIREDLIGKLGTNWDKPGKLVTLGPFLYQSYEPHHNIVLARNPGYYGVRGNVELVVAALVEEENAAIGLYDDRQIDFITRLAVETRKLKNRPDFIRWPEARIMHLDFNPAQGLMNDVRVRRAIAMALDRAKLARMLEGASGPASSFVTPGIMGYSRDAGFVYEPARARELLDKAAERELRSSELELVVAGFNDDVLTANFIADELKKNLGLQIKIHKLEPKQFYSPTVTLGGFAMILNRWTADFPDPDNFFSIFLSKSGNNRVGWKDPVYDELVTNARTIINPAKREAAYRAIHKLLVEDNVIAVPLYYGRNCALIRYGVKGFTPTPTNSYLFKDFSVP